jgi:hypothetical protein
MSLCYAAQEIEEMAPKCQSVQPFSPTECGCVAVTCPSEEEPRTEKPITTLPGTVEKIIKSRDPDVPERRRSPLRALRRTPPAVAFVAPLRGHEHEFGTNTYRVFIANLRYLPDGLIRPALCHHDPSFAVE